MCAFAVLKKKLMSGVSKFFLFPVDENYFEHLLNGEKKEKERKKRREKEGRRRKERERKKGLLNPARLKRITFVASLLL